MFQKGGLRTQFCSIQMAVQNLDADFGSFYEFLVDDTISYMMYIQLNVKWTLPLKLLVGY